MRFEFASFGFLLGLFAVYMSHNEATYIKLTNVICKIHNTTWIHIYECRLKAISRNKTVLNLNGTLDYPVHTIITKYQMFKRANGWKPWLLNTTFDSCLVLRTMCNPIAKYFHNLYSNYSNFNHSCPYVGPFIIQGFHVKSENWRLPLPTGQYLVESNWIFRKEVDITVKLFFEFKENIIDM